MPSPRLLLPASTLLVLGLCWSVNANPTEGTVTYGFVTNYVTPVANLSLDKLLGRWYIAEYVSFKSWPHVSTAMCLLLDFHYDDNGTLVVAPLTALGEYHTQPTYTLPVNDNGVWEVIGDGVLISSHAVVYVDDRFLAVVSCRNRTEKDCGALTLVRHVSDADLQGEVDELQRRVTSAGFHVTNGGVVKVIEPCRLVATDAPDLSAQNGPSTPDT